MKRFGLKSYYSEEGERCVLHVSVASVKGNIIKRIAETKNRYAGVTDIDSNELRSISLFGCKQILSDEALAEMESTLKSVPSSIPIRFDRVQCQFGKVKEVSIKL
jgi:predicted DNA binding protein